MLILALAVALVAQQPGTSPGPQAPSHPSASAEDRATSYYQFMLGRFLEGEGEIDAAIQAYERAIAADPGSAEIHAELAGLYARQNRADDATAAAETALKIDPENSEAHWVLGTVYASRAQGNTDGAPVDPRAVDTAIEHLEKARVTRRFDLGLIVTLGRLYMAKKDFPKAIEQLSWLAEQEPGAAEVGFMLAQAYEGAGKRDDAIAELRRVVDAEPRYFRAWVTLADLLEREGQPAEAADAYSRAVALHSRSVELRERQASALLKAGQTAAAGKLLRDLANEAPTDPEVLFMLSDVERQLGNYDEAETLAKRLIPLDPKGVRGVFALAQVYEARREHRKVIDTLEPTLRSAENADGARVLAPLYLRVGMAYQELGEFDRAIDAFERAKAASGNEPVLDAYLAQALLAAGQPARALAIASALRQAHPDDFRYARIEAEALAKRGDQDAAVAALQRAVDRPDADAGMYGALAGLCVEMERYECATATLQTADAKFPGNLLLMFQRGAMLEQQKRYDEAEKEFRRVLAKDPQHGPTLNYLGYMFADRGIRLNEAVSLLDRALKTDPFNGSYLDSLGWAHFKRGDLAPADKYLSMAADRLPRNSVVLEHLGDLRWKQGKRDAAIAAWEQALAGDRESIDPKVIAQKVEDARRAQP